jgi:hypothetical protein
LYLAGALYPAELTEAEHAVRWLRALRASDDPHLREAGVLLRTHPKRYDEWSGIDLAGLGPVAIWPQAEGDLLDARKEEESLDQETLNVLLEPVDEVREQYTERYSKAFGPLRVSAVSQPYLWDRAKFGPRQSVPLMTFTEDDVAMADREPRGLLAGSRTSG